MKKNSPAERHIAKIVIFFVGLTSAITLAVAQLAPSPYAIYAAGATALFGMAVTWFGREQVFQKILMRVPAVSPKHKLASGTWNIHITFDDGDGLGAKERSGSVTIFPSLLGVRIEGGMLLNIKDRRTTMNGWYADAAEMVTYEGHDILYYLYKVPIVDKSGLRSDENKFEKIGFVCASRMKDTNIFEGYFRDIRVREGIDKTREGEIRLVFNGRVEA